MSEPELPTTPLPGFEIRSAVVGVKLVFSVDRLVESDKYTLEGEIPLSWEVTADSKEEMGRILDKYYDGKDEIKEYLSPGRNFKMRAYEQDARVLAGLLASELTFEFSSIWGHSKDEIPDNREYSDWIADPETAAPEVSWEAISEANVDVEAEVNDKIPDGLSEVEFTHETYLEYTFDFVSNAVNEAEWQGGHAWLMNLGIHELRNGRYRAAAYAFEGAKNGLTKHRLWESSRIDNLVERCLDTLRKLCFLQADDSYDITNIELRVDLMNRDLVFYPEYSSTPTLFDQNFRFTTIGWVINTLLLVQATAHSMEAPTISRTEVDPFGTQMTTRNASFVLSLCAALSNQIREDIDESIKRLEGINFSQYSPDITLTRTLREAGYDVRIYGESNKSLSDDCDIEYDYVVERGDQLFLVRALRPEDRDKTTIRDLLSEVEGLEHQLMLLYEREIDPAIIDAYADAAISLNYIDLQNERISPVESGFPQAYDSLSTPEEIKEQISELYERAKKAETTQEKGDSLEELMRVVFESAVPDTSVQHVNNRTRVEEIDLQLRNKENRYPWKDLGAPINVECKNWNQTAGVDVIYTAYGKAKATSPDCKGVILVCWEGISDTRDKQDGDQAIREIRRDGINMLVLDKNDLKKISETGDAQAVFEDKMDELDGR